ncbi:hypothetical protein HA402_015664 [Bradysia odoriphaga]|nr:hypothetical protein HA402_015664 [Bradysia odoriphaga]
MELCRLCLLHQSRHINIFNSNEPFENVADLIAQHIGEVSQLDPLPKYVCIDCWTKIKNFHTFHRDVHAAQTKYLSELVKQEQDNNFVEIQEHSDQDQDSDFMCSSDNFEPFYNPTKIERVEIDVKPSDIIASDEPLNENVRKTRNAARSALENIRSISSDLTLSERHPNKFICDVCQAVISSKQKLKDHLLRHVNASYVCQICSQRFTNKKAVQKHNKAEHSQEMLSKLKDQQERFEKLSTSLTGEELKQILTQSVDSHCDICNKDQQTISLQQMKDHYKQQHDMDDGHIKCCGVKMTTDVEVNGHVYRHLHSDQLRCEACGKIISDSVEKMLSHLQRHIDELEKNPFKCKDCNKGFAQEVFMVLHRRYVHGIADGSEVKAAMLTDVFTMKCDLCANVSFTSLPNAKTHYMTEHGIKGYLLCCDSKFMSATSIEDHFKYHLDPSHFKCTYCGKCFDRKITLSVHMSKHKAVESKKFVCQVCGKAFLSNYKLKDHFNVHDKANRKSFQCTQCDKRYSAIQSLDFHVKLIHNKDGNMKRVICEYCGRDFVSRSAVNSHIHTVHQIVTTANGSRSLTERYECTVCDASFINKYRLKKHMDTIHMGTPEKCTICSKIAPNAAAMACHMRNVHVESSHKCNLCNKSFKAAVALKDHIATHTGEKLYKCSFCPEAFIWRPNMYSHQKKAHPKEWKKSQKKSIANDST